MIFLLLASFCMLNSCVTKRKRGETSKIGKLYHNMTAKYNGYFNANEIMKETMLQLRNAHQDNYTQIIDVYDYVEVENPKAVSSELDKAIEKVTTVAALHEPSNYVDDCYVLMGKAQFLKHEYETAEETFEFFREDFNPSNPYGRNYQKKKLSSKQKKKLKEQERNEERKLKQEERKKQDKIKEDAKKAKEKEKEEAKKKRAEEAKRKKKQREELKKKRDKEKKERKKNKKRRSKRRDSKKDTKKEETPKEETTKEEPKVEETKEEVAPDPITETQVAEAQPKVNESPIEKEEESTSKKKKDKKEVNHDNTSYSEGLIWLARTYIQRERYSSAEYLLNKLDSEEGINDDVRREIGPARAKLELEQKNYDKAIPHLRTAIETSNKGHLKARYAFIIGQIYQMSGNYSGALQAFKDVKDHGGDFIMEFNAELNIAKNQLLTSERSKEKTLKKLAKMLKEGKYEEFRDQIYFTMGDIELSQDNFSDALMLYQRSISNNVNNKPLKVETYYKLATLFYNKEDYVDSKYYFDSTLMVMTKEDPRYDESSSFAQNLQEIAKNIEIIAEQDSLIALSTLSDEDQRAYALKVLEEEKANMEKANEDSKASKAESNVRPSSRRSFGRSNFFAYNIAAKQKGIKDFEDKWGERVLEDDWRRSDRQNVSDIEETEEGEVAEVKKDEISEGEVERVLNTIPNNPAKMAKISGKLSKALFDLGTAYRDRLRKYGKSATTLERLVNEFADYEKELDAFYYLYLDYLDLENSASARKYFDKIIAKYPDTKYAQALQDPDFAKKLLDADQEVEKYYNETYDLFESAEYETVLTRIENTKELFGKDNKLKPKFGLLKAMSLGNTKGEDEYIKELQAVITKFPNTPEQIKAKEILRFLKGDSEAFSAVQAEEVDNIYDLEDDKLHYMAVVVYDSSKEKFDQAKISVSGYNKTYHKIKRLQMSGDIFLDKENGVQMFIIRKFIDKEKVMAYYNEILKDKNSFIDESVVNYELFPVTQRNYRKIIREKSITVYRAFFEKNYLK